MDIDGFGVQEVKNKIENLRSTYSQELNKINDSKRSGAVLSNVYTSNIKWLKEMEEVFIHDLKRKTYENINEPSTEDTIAQENDHSVTLQSRDTEAITTADVTQTNATNLPTSASTSSVGNSSRARKRSSDIVKAVSDLKSLHEQVNSAEENPLDVFGKSVASQLL
ncbi:unnamed protein product [Acanthoscelides obtectus]|uniref:MADF domain-containing protein n=1 Tax=Acanthoscelides obtectus TaxID=200917 RepID=A0A9P0PA53_ACAOB|nr:unnamed protein product [Acanthoscelides obtectus]CAK1661687.1 hypothetical protein AOBTE_LOCUS22740 [Acanthoscelides obtectus]